jgi:hypothetical protein
LGSAVMGTAGHEDCGGKDDDGLQDNLHWVTCPQLGYEIEC